MIHNRETTLLIGFKLLTTLGMCILVALSAHAGDDWQAISPEELKMTAEPKAPGAPAVYLYRQVDRDDQSGREVNYQRIKILTEEGRKYADVEIPFFKELSNVRNIKARTIQPDGSISNFDGKIYEKTVVKVRGLKYLAKTFTLPDVRVGSVIEYRYTVELPSGLVYDSVWILSSDLFTKLARFSLKSATGLTLRWSWPNGLPEGTQPPKEEHGLIRMEAQNVPAFQDEDFMPPEREIKLRVDFVYGGTGEKDPAKFWQKIGKDQFDTDENFLNKHKAMEQAVATIVSPQDSPESKLQKIYARVQQMRNRSFEREKSEQEQKREKQKDINNVEDVWKQGAGYGRQLNFLFVALVRAAGMEAYHVDLSTRNSYFFNPAMMNVRQLDSDAVLVKLNGKDVYFDPGTAYAPYAVLPWSETASLGLRPDKDGGGWIQTPLPESSLTRIERRAKLTLTEEGTLEGKLTVTYSGIEALQMRRDERDEDEASHRKTLEDLVKEAVPVGIDVELANQPDWTSSAPTFVAQYNLKVPGWAASAGRKVIVPVGLFSGSEKHLFEHANRVHPVYFEYPYQKVDDITIDLPLGWKVGSVSPPVNQDAKAVAYTTKAEEDHGSLHIVRKLRMDVMTVDRDHYPVLRSFFQIVRSGDEQQVVLQAIR